MERNYRFIDPPLEVIVGDAVEMVLECSGDRSPGDWVGIYPQSIPTVPGVSHGRWKYISTFSETQRDAMSPKGKKFREKHRKIIRFDPSFVPNHAGRHVSYIWFVL